MSSSLPKGYQMEEALRRYFIKSGYYTVRGVPFVYQGFDISDIDVWLYTRPSSVARHRIVVDCKNKTTPKAIERIFWTKGLQYVLGVEQAIVATTEKRPAVTDFGREHEVLILDGTFLDKLQKTSGPGDERLTEEQFTALVSTYHPTKEGGDWKGRVKAAKRPLASGLGYNAINSWSAEARYFAEQAQLVTTHKELGCRILYLLLSFIAVAFDFVMKDLSFSEPANKLATLSDGLRYGSRGPAGTQEIVQLAVGLIEHYAPENRVVAPRIRERFAKDVENIPARILAEYFGKPSVSQELFSVAKELEGAAYSAKFIPPESLSAGAKGTLGVFLDYWDMRRTRFFDGFDNLRGKAQVPAVSANPAPSDASSEDNNAQAPLPGFKVN